IGQQVLPLGVQNGDQVGAVVHGDLRLVIERRHDVGVIYFVIFAFDGVNGDVVIADQAGGHVILRGKRVGSAKHDVGAAVAEGNHQIGRFGGDMQASRHADIPQRLRLDELFANGLQNGHGLEGPFDAALADVGEREIFYITSYCF